MKTTFVGGALSFKGEGKKAKKKKSSKSKHKTKEEEIKVESGDGGEEDDMTEAEKKALLRKRERERKDLEKLASKSHREHVEEFNEKLSNLTEHHDIPRVSAAGNG